MDYYILCFGRTDFTRYTVESIWRHSTAPPKITLINNGWTAAMVPPTILEYWKAFVEDAKKSGMVADVIENPVPLIGKALTAFQTANRSSDKDNYWISDNDCVIGSDGYEELANTLLLSYPELHKLGIDFYRWVSRQHCEEFRTAVPLMDAYLWQLADSRIVPAGQEADYCQVSGNMRANYQGDPLINNNISDTTLSIVRKGVEVTQSAYRYSYSIASLQMLHIGYLEPIYMSDNEVAVCEMLHYMNLRPLVLTEWAESYNDRKKQYIANLMATGNLIYIEKYNALLNKSE